MHIWSEWKSSFIIPYITFWCPTFPRMSFREKKGELAGFGLWVYLWMQQQSKRSSKSESEGYDSEYVSGHHEAAPCRDILSLPPPSCFLLSNCWWEVTEEAVSLWLCRADTQNLKFPAVVVTTDLLQLLSENISRSVWSGVCQKKLKYKCDTAAAIIQLDLNQLHLCCFLSGHISWKSIVPHIKILLKLK